MEKVSASLSTTVSKFSVLLGCPFHDPSARESKLFFLFLSVLIISYFSNTNSGIHRAKRKQGTCCCFVLGA
jgi:hypothetical protein